MSDPTGLRAGAGRAEIRLDRDAFPIDGFTSQHDPLHVRVLLLEAENRRAAVVSVEMTSLPDRTVEDIAELVGELTHTRADQILVAATHTFSAPHLPPQARLTDGSALSKAVEEAVCSAADASLRALRPARMSSGSGVARVAVNRDVETPEGWWLGADDSGPTDPEVGVVTFRDDTGAQIAVLFAAAVQSSILNGVTGADGGRVVSADLAGAAAQHIEQRIEDRAVALFLVGAAGDQAPYLVAPVAGTADDPQPSAGLALVHALGTRLGEVTLSTAARLPPGGHFTAHVDTGTVQVRGQRAPASFRDLSPSHDYVFHPAEDQAVPFWILQLGEVALVALRPELSSTTGAWVKAHSPNALTIVATMVNGGAKYLPDAGSYDRRTYEAMSSRYARGGAEVLAAALVDTLTSAAEAAAAVPVAPGSREEAG